MTRSTTLLLLAGLLLSACKTPGQYVPEAPTRADLSAELIRLDKPGPPSSPEGACWASDITPMVVETVTEQIVTSPEKLGPDGAVIAPASYRTETHQRIVQEREEIWFRAPCAQEWTVDFVATLQRALKARGYYLLPVSGELDAPTREAVHRFQIDRGLDSPQLSLAAAQELGIIAVDRSSL
ncbi:peptidoglycan-binding domain-containing protein [Thioclava sp. FR2]|uniref:peptidoglycan-binding domain-containing protein n=1 Tax=Thioclava sp. FR2 TaxID=3445780 RepID=UPI003EBC4CB8